ncbi:MAG: hypothetical protein GTO02_21090 [Candidatus Dadabacteria bacterium]|nr:hypothetical protein [Candidatus Dadabacteria bacterium]
MESMQVLESKLRDYIEKNDKLFNDYSVLMKEVQTLRQNVTKLESEKEEIKKQINNVIEKVELYLNNVEM